VIRRAAAARHTSIAILVGRGFGLCLVGLLLTGLCAVAAVTVTARGLDEFLRFEPQHQAHDAALQGLTDAETSVRGYRLSGDPAFLAPYWSGKAAYQAELQFATNLAQDPQVRRLLAEERRVAEAWVDGYAGPLASTPPHRLGADHALEARHGKALFDEVRAAHEASSERIAQVQARRLDGAERTQAFALIAAVAALALGLIVAVLAVLRTYRRVVGPLHRLRATIGRMRGGETSVRADVTDGPAEVRLVAEALNVALQDSARAQAARAEDDRLREMARSVGRRLSSSLDTDEVLMLAAEAVGSELGADRVYVRLVRDGTVTDSVGEWYAERLGPIAGSPIDNTASPSADQLVTWLESLQTQQRLWCADDVRGDSDLPPHLRDEHVRVTGARSSLLVPLGTGTTVLGYLGIVQVHRVRVWDAALVDAVKVVAADLSRALLNADLYAQQRELVQQLQDLDRAKTDFVSTVSHELRTPLTSISGYVELMQDGDAGEVTGEMDRMLSVVHRNTERLRTLIDDLLTLARIESGSIRLVHAPVDIAGLLTAAASTIAPAAAAAGVALEVTSDPACPTVMGDGGQLERVVLNLISNAVKFTPAGGSVRVCARPSTDGVVIEVSDTGIGIPEAEQPRLFSRFFRASNATDAAIQGTGLGLTIVRSMVEHHGGRIDVRSAPGVGTTMLVTLPAATAVAADQRGMAVATAAL
jgi:two-component system phosphate regulon sensor histidine kinase PhoR